MILMQTRYLRTIARTVSALGAAVLTACAAPPTRFYMLGPDGHPTIESSTARPSFRIDMRPVKVPAAVARNQLVVQINAAQVQVLEDDRWASSLSDQVRYALIADVSQQPSAAGGQGSEARARDKDVPLYQVSVDVQRFESWPGSHVLVDVVWDIRGSAGVQTLTCHSVVSESVSDGYPALVEGHRHAISAVAMQIAEVARAFAATPTDSPSRPVSTSSKAGNTTVSCPQFADDTRTTERLMPRFED